MTCQIRGEDFILHPARILIWPRESLVVVADIHLGKAQTFQQSGLWLPPAAHGRDLDQLLDIAEKYDLKHALFLGDFVHSRAGVTGQVIEEFVQWQNRFQGQVTIVIGNHDRPLVSRWPEAWNFSALVESVSIRGFEFQHEPPEASREDTFTFCGHIHPKIHLRQGPEKLDLPAFVITPNVGYLPAYSSLAGGASFAYSKKNRYFVPSAEQVVEVVF